MKKILLCLASFLLVFSVHFRTERSISTDSRWSTYVAHSIVNQGNTNIDEYFSPVGAVGWEFKYGNYWYNYFPIGSSLFAVPVVWAYKNHGGFQKFIANRVSENSSRDVVDYAIRTNLEVFVASVCVAFSAILVFLIAIFQGLNIPFSLLLAASFGFASSSWTVSRGLWQHTPLILMVLVSLYLILRANKNLNLLGYLGIPLAVAFIVRPTAAQFILPIMIFVLLKSPKQLLRLILFASPIAFIWMSYNYSIYGSVFQPYYQPGRLSLFSDTYVEAFLGNLFSPSRGFMVFHPIFILSIFGLVLKIRNRDFSTLDKCLVAWVILHIHSISSYGHWWAGHSTGPRLMTDILPAAVYFMIPSLLYLQRAFAAASSVNSIRRQLFIVSGLAVLWGCSFVIHYNAASNPENYLWNVEPKNVDAHPERLWDWQDAQVLRGIEKLF